MKSPLPALALFCAFILPTIAAAPLTYDQQEAHLKSWYAHLVPTLPPGTVSVIDQPYVPNPIRGISPDSSQLLDLFVPAGPGPFPLVVNIHGGGWHAGGKEGGIAECKPYLLHGIAYASLGYRWVQDAHFPAQMEDCNDAIGWLRAHAAQYHLDPNEVGVFGHSAGAHLCALIGTTGDGTTFKNPQKVQAVVCASGPFDLDRDRGQWPKSMFMWNPRDPMAPFFPNGAYDTAFARYASPETYIHPGLPPFFILHGDADTTVPLGQAQVFAADLKKAGDDVTIRVGPGKNHGSILDAQAKAESLAFFEKNLLHQVPNP
jgi:acetyl esterase/lipase